MTPDGREHPFGLTGRMFDGMQNGGKIADPGAAVNESGAKGPGSRAPADGAVPSGIVGPIFDGHGGIRPPDIKLPFGGKTAKPDTLDGKTADGRTGRDQAEAKSPAEALVGIFDRIKSGIGGGWRGAQTDKTDATGRTGQGDGGNFANRTRQLPPGATGLVVTGVRTKPWPIGKDGSPTTAVTRVAPFLSGTGGAPRITKDVATVPTRRIAANVGTDTIKQPPQVTSSNPLIAPAKPGPRLVEKGQTIEDGYHLGGDTIPHIVPEFPEGLTESQFDTGKIKVRPSVSLHIPGGKYGGASNETKANVNDKVSANVEPTSHIEDSPAHQGVGQQHEVAANLHADIGAHDHEIASPEAQIAQAAAHTAQYTGKVSQVTGSVFLPSEVVSHSAGSTANPAETATHPAEGAVHPAEGAVHPAEGAVHPAEAAVHPAEGAVHPAEATVHPAEDSVHPTEAGDPSGTETSSSKSNSQPLPWLSSGPNHIVDNSRTKVNYTGSIFAGV